MDPVHILIYIILFGTLVREKLLTPASYIKSCLPSAVLLSGLLVKILSAFLVPPIRVITHIFLVMVQRY